MAISPEVATTSDQDTAACEGEHGMVSVDATMQLGHFNPIKITSALQALLVVLLEQPSSTVLRGFPTQLHRFPLPRQATALMNLFLERRGRFFGVRYLKSPDRIYALPRPPRPCLQRQKGPTAGDLV